MIEGKKWKWLHRVLFLVSDLCLALAVEIWAKRFLFIGVVGYGYLSITQKFHSPVDTAMLGNTVN